MKGAITLGVIGHVDHGKTALVRALTGIETDRLKEERERGLSIVLGFSWLETTTAVIDLIDVPGHENFIRAMISGATGIDGILLCVAANEGISRQTIEHFNVASILGVSRGVIVVTKADLAEPADLARLHSSLREFVDGTFLGDAPIVDCSAETGAGLEGLIEQMNLLAAVPIARADLDDFFLPVDRVFTLQGHGVVVTGTLRRGRLRPEDRIEAMPGQLEATVRSLQVHGRSVDIATPGQRVAVNLRGLGREQLASGQVIATPGTVSVTRRIDAALELLEDAPSLRNGELVQLLTGTTKTTARARLLGTDALESGATGLVQWRLDRPVATHVSERYVIRRLSPSATLGGGRFLDVAADRHRRFDPSVQARLLANASGDASRIVLQRLTEGGVDGLTVTDLARETGVPPDVLRATVVNCGAVEVAPDRYASSDVLDRLREALETAIDEHHRQAPQEPGIGLSALAKLTGTDPQGAVFVHAVKILETAGTVRIEKDVARLAAFDPFASLTDRERAVLGRIEASFLEAGLQVAKWKTIVANDPLQQSMFRLLLQSRRLVRLRTYDRDAETVVHSRSLDDAIAKIASAYPYPASFAVKDVRDVLQSTRRYVVPVLEHLDAIGATERTGDMRRLRSG